MLAEVQSLQLASFTGLDLDSPTALCCVGGCRKVIGKLQDLAMEAVHGTNPHGMVFCANRHETPLHHFVGMVPGAKGGLEAELLYWRHVAEAYTSTSDEGTVTLPAHIRTAMTTALVRWSASMWQEDGVRPSRCPRLWVGVRRARDAALLLRPMCEHLECLHALRPFQQTQVGTWGGLRAALSGHNDTMAHGDSATAPAQRVAIRDMMEQSGRVLETVTRDETCRDYDAQTLNPEDVSDGVETVLTSIDQGTMVPESALTSIHDGLRHPLQWERVLTRPSDGDATLSRLWLCKRHADSTKLKQVQQQQQAMVLAVSRLVQWFWHDGESPHAYGHECTALLESAYQNKDRQVVLHAAPSDSIHTVQLYKSPMRVVESGATVLRISGET